MKNSFSPMRLADALTLERQGDILIVNGEPFDFTELPEGAELPAEAIASSWFNGPVSRLDGALNLALILPHGADAPQATLFPEPLVADEDGPIAIPAYSQKGA